MRETVESYGLNFSEELYELRDTISKGLSELASAIEWGFDKLDWRLQQQTDVLISIDHTLKTPSATKANEWRLQAEELMQKGVLEESEEFFLKALNEYRLDFRIYIGLAKTYLQMNKHDKAKVFLEKSLPHAPKKEIDWKSYSYRLIGHIYACEEDYNQAVSILRTSIELSPTYEDGHYDYAQYCAQMRNKETCLSSLQKAILAKPLYWYLAQKERNFDPLRSEVEKLLSDIHTEASTRAKNAISKSMDILKDVNKTISNTFEEAEEAISKAKQALIISRDKAELESITTCENVKSKYSLAYENAKSTLEKAKDKVASGDYVAFLEAQPLAEEAISLARKAGDIGLNGAKNTIDKANKEREHYQNRRAEKVKNAWKNVPGLIWKPVIIGIILSFSGCTIGYIGSYMGYFVGIIPRTHSPDNYAGLGFFGGGIVGFVYGIVSAIKEIKKKLER